MSIVGYVFSFGSRPVTWDYKKQCAFSLSLVVEYQLTTSTSQEALWL
jgi:hypothetical protein